MTKLSRLIIQIIMTLILVSLIAIGFIGLYGTNSDYDIISKILFSITLGGMGIIGLWWVWFCAPEAVDE